MPRGLPEPTHPSFSPDAIRAAIRGRAAIPAQMLERSLHKVNSLLDAKETKFFSFGGTVGDTREVEAYNIQIKAAELILQMSDLLARGQQKPPEPTMILEVDAKTGVMRLVIGTPDDEVPQLAPVVIESQAQVVPREIATDGVQEPEVQNEVVEEEDTSEEWETVKAQRGKLDPAVRAALFGQ